LDAMHTQTDTATTILKAGGDYVFTVKANMPTLHKNLKELPWKDVPSYTATTTGRGRRVTRTIKVVDVRRMDRIPRRSPSRVLRCFKWIG
jgi:predicted transposase YbfD/YdcC